MGLLDLDELWYEKQPSLATRMLRTGMVPLEALYKTGLYIVSHRQKAVKVDCRVVSIGNLTVGGNGKTPLVMEFASMLMQAGKRVAIVSRGYGRKSKGTRVVYAPAMPIPDVGAAGDEPTLMSIRCPDACIVIGQDRVDAARLAVQTWHPDVILCDDAFGHRSLYRDLDILAVHAQRGFGNNRLLPAGPMRESKSAFGRAGLVVFSYATDETTEQISRRHGVDESVLSLCCGMQVQGLVTRDFENLEGEMPHKVVAASSIANPEGFVSDIRGFGVDLVGDIRWRDHHMPSPKQWNKVRSMVNSRGADAVVVTEKDLVRMRGQAFDFAVLGLRIGAVWKSASDEAKVVDLLLGDGADRRQT